jgi:hypothetical protein
VESWYWGHGRLGPYSLVWFDVIYPNGTEYVSGYAAKDGKIITTTCSGVKVRPTGKGSEYPPKITSGLPQGYHLDMDLGDAGILSVDITTDQSIADAILYERWIGTLKGGIVGGEIYSGGRALYEQFRFAPLN